MLRAVIFDLGGTLVDYQAGTSTWVHVETAALRDFHAWLIEAELTHAPREPFVSTSLVLVEEMWRAACEGGASFEVSDFLARACAANGLEIPLPRMTEGVKRYLQTIQAQTTLLDGAPEVLAGLKDRGLKLGLISNTMWPAWMHVEDLRRFRMDLHFDAMLFSGDCGWWKPQPEVFQRMLDRLGIAADEAVFVGDSPANDIVGAQRAGIRAVWIETPGVSLDGVEPDATIRRLAELPDVLDGMGSS